jgi:hypothetical protein
MPCLSFVFSVFQPASCNKMGMLLGCLATPAAVEVDAFEPLLFRCPLLVVALGAFHPASWSNMGKFWEEDD